MNKNICGSVVTFVAIGGRSWSFLIVNFKMFKPKNKNLLGCISIIFYPDSVARKISF